MNAVRYTASGDALHRGHVPIGENVSLAPAETADAFCGDLRGETVGHGAVVSDTDSLALLEAAGLRRMDQNLLGGAQVAHQQLTRTDPQDPGGHGDRFGMITFHEEYLQTFRIWPILCGRAPSGAVIRY